jgi:hypothetical protein
MTESSVEDSMQLAGMVDPRVDESGGEG